MPLIIDPQLPAARTLMEEGLVIKPHGHYSDRCLRIALVNLMPVKPDTELDFMRLMAQSAYPIELLLVNTASHTSRHTPAEHMARFYRTFHETIQSGPIHGVIITGAPLEFVKFEHVDYWPEITGIFSYLRQHRIPTLYICWAAFAGLYFHHGIPMGILPTKISGVYHHRILSATDPLMHGINDGFTIPHSRFASWNRRHITADPQLRIIAESTDAGVYMAAHETYPEYYITGHGEYAPLTLDSEYRRDLSKGMQPSIPRNYYPDDNPGNPPVDTWHVTATRIMHNWIDTLVADKH